MNPKMKHHKMDEGSKLGRSPNKPVLSVIQDGERSYIWVGNDAPDDMACFATICGKATLLRIADDVHRALGVSRRSSK